MKREFGAPLVEKFLPSVDVQTVIDASGAYIPGHGTPTILLFGRSRPPVWPTRCASSTASAASQASPPTGQGARLVSNRTLVDRARRARSIRACERHRSRAELSGHPMTLGVGRDLATRRDRVRGTDSCR